MESTENIDFYKYWCVFKRRWLPAVAVFGAVVFFTYKYMSSKVPIYSAQGQLLFMPDKTSSLVKFDSESQKEQVSSPNDRSQATEAQVIRSASILKNALDRVKQITSQEIELNLGHLQQGIEITNIEGTDILQVAYKSNDPKVAALVVNQLMLAYVENNLASNRAAASLAGNFVNAQLPRLKANVDRADAVLRKFKENNKITDLAQTQESVAANIERIGNQIDSVEAQLADLNARSKALQSKLGMSSQQAMTISSLSQSSTVKGVLADLQEVQSKLADERARYKEGHPSVTQLKDKQAQLTTLLQAEVGQFLQGQKTASDVNLQVGQIQEALTTDLIKLEVERIGLVTQTTTLSNQQAFYQKRAAVLPRLEQEYGEQQRELSAAQSTYETLLKSFQEIQVIQNRTVGNVRIIQAAQVPAVPISSNKASAMAAGNLAGLLIAAGVVYVLEVTDKKIKTVKEAKDIFKYPVLGAIPAFGKKTRTVVSIDRTSEASRLALPVIERPRSSISESYRLLQANLNSNSDKTLKVIVVTSSVPKEGKSTTCANLAVVMAQLNYSVLIIDADIRHPSQHNIWQISNKVGLMNVIAAQSSLSGTALQRVMKNLDVLTAGVSTSDSDVFVDSRKIATLIEQCPNKYDYVIIDTPSLATAADASLLGKMADGLVIVTRLGLADSIKSKFAKEYLDQSDLNILGIVVNGVRPENEPYSYYHYAEVY